MIAALITFKLYILIDDSRKSNPLTNDRESEFTSSVAGITTVSAGVNKLGDVVRILLTLHKIKSMDIFLVIPFAYRLCSIIPQIHTCLRIICDMMNKPDKYMYPSVVEHCTRLTAFRELVRLAFPKTYAVLQKLDALSDRLLAKIFVGLFFDVLVHEHAMRILDMYMICGDEIVFRYGLALLRIFKKQIKSGAYQSGEDFWNSIKRQQRTVDFQALSIVAFEEDRSLITRQPPTKYSRAQILAAKSKYSRATIGRISSMTEFSLHQLYNTVFMESSASTWFDDSLWRRSALLNTTQAVNLQIFLGEILMSPNAFQRVFSTAVDGFSMQTMLERAEASSLKGPCLLLLRTKKHGVTLGAYVSCPLSKVVGDKSAQALGVVGSGEVVGRGGVGGVGGDPTCFVFRFDKKSKRYFSPLMGEYAASLDWDTRDFIATDFGLSEREFVPLAEFLRALHMNTVVTPGNQEYESAQARLKRPKRTIRLQRLYDQQEFIRCTEDAIYMGTNAVDEPRHALRLFDNLRSLTSDPCDTYRNPPLAPEESITAFKLESVELYCAEKTILQEPEFVEENATEVPASKDDKSRGSFLTTKMSFEETAIQCWGGELAQRSVTPVVKASPLSPLPNPLPADFVSDTSRGKQKRLWDKISNAPYPEDALPNALTSGWSMLNPSYLARTFTLAADECVEGRKKGFNTYGSAARVVFKVKESSDGRKLPSHPFTGLFATGAPGILRFSLGKPVVSGDDPFCPAIALKLLICGKPSVNLFAAGDPGGQWLSTSAGGQQGNGTTGSSSSSGSSGSSSGSSSHAKTRQSDRNFFSSDLCTSPTGTSHVSSIPLVLLPRRIRPTSWAVLPLHKAASVTSTGDSVAATEAVTPVKVVFSPDAVLREILYGGDKDGDNDKPEEGGEDGGRGSGAATAGSTPSLKVAGGVPGRKGSRNISRDFRLDLSSLEPGTVLYSVIAFPEGGGGRGAAVDAAAVSGYEIGEIVLESHLVSSKYGDEHLFFQHPLPMGK